MSLNKVYCSGTLVRDPEFRPLPSGVGVCNLCVAVTSAHEDENRKPIERTVFLDVAVWEKHGEWCKKNLQKGDIITLEGMLQQDNWTDDQGNKRSKIKVRADRVNFIGHKHSTPPKFDEGSCGGAFDGNRVTSDADGGL